MIAELVDVLQLVAQPDRCRAYVRVDTGEQLRDCPGGAATVVSVVCEHEHIYDVALCQTHIDHLPRQTIGCPLCWAAESGHKCRHAILAGAR